MADFCIQVVNNKVKTERIIDGGLDVIRFSGEEWIAENGYWDKFKSKIEYIEGEQLAFVVISDTSSFDLDSSIQISDKFTNSDNDIEWIIDGFDRANDHVSLFPETLKNIKAAVVERKQEQNVKTASVVVEQEVTEIEVPNSNSLQSYYRKATRDLKRGNQ